MAYCRKCGTELNDGVKFCPKCGEKVEENHKQQCQQCGFERQGTEKFCPKCGTPFESSEIVEEKKNPIRRYAIVGILCLLVLLACIYFIFFNDINNTKPTVEFVTVDTAYYENTSDSYDNTTSQNTQEQFDTDDNNEDEVDVSAIIEECQEEVSSIQEEMESLCNNFLISASGDLDMLSFGRLKSNFTMAYSELEEKANDAFDRCIKELIKVGDTNSANQMKEEKKEFGSASLKLRYETQASAEEVD